MLIRYSLISLLSLVPFWDLDLRAQNEPVMVGWTYGSAQSIVVPGDKIAVDDSGSIHFTWMKFFTPQILRSIYYNRVDPEGNVVYGVDGVPISLVNGAAFPQVGITQGNRAAIAYHSAYDTTYENYVVYAVDLTGGPDPFHHFDPPDLIRYHCYWPRFTIDRSEIVHIIATEHTPNPGEPMIMGHCYSTNGGYVWSKFVAIDTLMTVSNVIVSSPVSEKVSIVYCHPTDLNWQIRNDIYFRQVKSDDNYIDYRSRPVNVTEYGQNNDSLYAFGELDAIFDYNDNLHIVWSAFWVTDNGVNPTMYLYHYDYDSGTIAEVIEAAWLSSPNCPYGNLPIENVTLGASENVTHPLFVAYTMFNENDCSSEGFANGDVYFQDSWNGGQTWHMPVNITNTNSNNCNPGECRSEISESLADRVTEDGFMHLSYIENKSGGDTVVLNPVYYHKFDPYPVGIFQNGIEMSMEFYLLRAFPNPFNARTTIEFTLAEPGDAELTIYDITGAKVGTIKRPGLEAGRHSVVWNAAEVASGVYFARLEAGGESKSIKMVLLK